MALPARAGSRLRPGWPLIAGMASLAMLAAAHGFERLAGLAPCHLCLQQREVYWVALMVSGLLLALDQTPAASRTSRPGNLVLALVFLFGSGLAAFHAGVEWHWWPGPTTCTGVSTLGVSADSLGRLMQGGDLGAPACDKAAWVFLGLSMAGWNSIISLGLAGLSVRMALRPESIAA